MDLTKLPFFGIYKLCSINNFQAEADKNQIKLGIEPFNLLHNDIIGPFIKSVYKAIDFVTLFYDTNKRFKIVLLSKI